MLPLASSEHNPEVVEGSELAAEKMDEDVAPGDSADPDNTIEGNTLYTCFFCGKHRKKVVRKNYRFCCQIVSIQ